MIYDKPEDFIYNGIIYPIEVWKPVTDEMVPGVRPIYWISCFGNLYNSETGRYSNATVKPGDYVRVELCHTDGTQHMTTIHRLVCMAFNGLPPDPSYEVDHINCEKSCSIYKNLEWVTKQENNRRAHANNLCKIAEDNYRSILTNDEVRDICEMLSKGIDIDIICDIMDKKIYPRAYTNGLKGIIYQILSRSIWTSISKDYVFHDYSRIHLTDDQVHMVCKALKDDICYDDIIDHVLQLECDQHKRDRLKETFYNIKRGRAFVSISSHYNIKNTRKFSLTNDELLLACQMSAKKCSNKDIFEALSKFRPIDNSIRNAVYGIQNGSCHKNIVDSFR